MNTHPKTNQAYDAGLYALKTATLEKIAKEEGAYTLIEICSENEYPTLAGTTIKVTIARVLKEVFTCLRDAYIYAIEQNRQMRQKGGKAK